MELFPATGKSRDCFRRPANRTSELGSEPRKRHASCGPPAQDDGVGGGEAVEGDPVLSGLAGSLLAAGLSPLDAASTAAYLHGLAGRYAAEGAPTSAHDVAESIPAAWRDVTS